MTLIIRPRRKKVRKVVVETDDEGVVVKSSTVAVSDVDSVQDNNPLYDTWQDAENAHTVIAQSKAISIAYAMHENRWVAHPQQQLYLQKQTDAIAYRQSMGVVVSDLIHREAVARGLTDLEMVEMIEAKAWADTAMVDAEIDRITEKLALP